MRFLGFDAGGSAARWAVVARDGALVGRGETNGFSGHIHDEVVRARADAAIATMARAARAFGDIAGVHAGVTGLSAETPEARTLADNIAAALACPASAVVIEDDVSLSFRACFTPGAGVLVYAGTGSLALHITAAGERWRAGGHGILIDDEGSAAWVARNALRRLLARDDAAPGAGWNTPLGRAFAGRFGGADWPSARLFVYGAHRGEIGQLARAVSEAAAADDDIAIEILDEAGLALARLAKTLLARTGPQPVALAGGATRLSPRVAENFMAALGDGATAHLAEIDAALTAARLAAQAHQGVGRRA